MDLSEAVGLVCFVADSYIEVAGLAPEAGLQSVRVSPPIAPGGYTQAFGARDRAVAVVARGHVNDEVFARGRNAAGSRTSRS